MSITDFDSEFWTDPWMRKRTPHAKFLYIYLFTAPHKNRAGIYPIDLKQIEFESGMDIEKIKTAFKELEPKVIYDHDAELVYVSNHFKRQYARKGTVSETILKSTVSDLCKLPQEHDFVDLFLSKYSQFFSLKEGVGIGYLGGLGKGRVKEGFSKDVKYNEAFQKFWDVYPTRNNKKLGKPDAYELFLKFPEKFWSQIVDCAKNYGQSQRARDNYAKDPERFLKNNYWMEWMTPEVVPEKTGYDPTGGWGG